MNTNPEPQATKLLPCPFCGLSVASLETAQELKGDDYSDDQWAVVCGVFEKGCGTTGPYRDSTDEARNSWNRRTTHAPEPPASEQPISKDRLGIRCDDRWHHAFKGPAKVILDFYDSGELVVLVQDGTGMRHLWWHPLSTPTGKESEPCPHNAASAVDTIPSACLAAESNAAPSGPTPEGAAMSHEVAIGEPQGLQCSTGEPQSALPSAGSETPTRYRHEKLCMEQDIDGNWIEADAYCRLFAENAKLRERINDRDEGQQDVIIEQEKELTAARAELETAKARIKELERDLCQIDPDKLTEQRDKLRADLARVTKALWQGARSTQRPRAICLAFLAVRAATKAQP